MKNYRKIAFVFALLACFGTAKAEEASLKGLNDSVNYTLGIANGSQLATSLLDASADEMKIAAGEFADALQRGWDGNVEELSPTENEGKSFAIMLKKFEKSGLGEIQAWALNEKLLFQGVIRGMNNDTIDYPATAGNGYVEAQYAIDQDAPKSSIKPVIVKAFKDKQKKVKIKSHNDSINFYFGILFGHQIRQYILAQDSDGTDRKAFIAAINKGMASKIKYPELVAYGENIGKQIKADADNKLMGISCLSTDFPLLKRGMAEGLMGAGSISYADAVAYLETTIPALQSKERMAWLDENAKRPEVIVTESGLQYEILTATEGPKPNAFSTVWVHYEGKLTDGTIFDSSYQRGEPISFPLNGVIAGWTEGLQLMSVGSKYKFYIPYYLGYGEQGAGGVIPPYATLIFTVELLEIQ